MTLKLFCGLFGFVCSFLLLFFSMADEDIESVFKPTVGFVGMVVATVFIGNIFTFHPGSAPAPEDLPMWYLVTTPLYVLFVACVISFAVWTSRDRGDR